MINKISAKVKAVNRAREQAMKLYDQLRPIFEPLVGQAILKVDGTLLAKVAKLLPELPYTPALQIHRHVSNFTFGWIVKTSEPNSGDPQGFHTVLYHEIAIYIGELEAPENRHNTPKTILRKLCDRPNYRTDYTVEEVKQKQNALKIAQKAVDEAQSALWPFNEND